MRHRLLAMLAFVPSLFGCVMHAQQLRTLPLVNRTVVEPSQQTTARILIHPFTDLRGDVYSIQSATSQMPIIHAFHKGLDLRFPERAGGLTGQNNTVLVGELTTALPALLATSMRQMKLSPTAVTLDEMGPQVELDGFDYVVVGNVISSRLVSQDSALAAFALGVLGVPFQRVDFELAYEVLLYRGDDRTHPLWRRTYAFNDWRVGGLYYNRSSARQLFVRGLQETLKAVVNDVALACYVDGQRQPRPDQMPQMQQQVQ